MPPLLACRASARYVSKERHYYALLLKLFYRIREDIYHDTSASRCALRALRYEYIILASYYWRRRYVKERLRVKESLARLICDGAFSAREDAQRALRAQQARARCCYARHDMLLYAMMIASDYCYTLDMMIKIARWLLAAFAA